MILMTNEAIPLKIRYSTEFKRELKRLHKRYKSIQKDVTEFIVSSFNDEDETTDEYLNFYYQSTLLYTHT